MNEYRLRPMRPDDLEPVVAIIHAHQEDDGRLSKKYFESYFGDRRKLDSPREQNYVAIHRPSRELVGVGGYGPDSMDWPEILWLRWLYVAELHRDKGIGRMLMRQILGDARDLETRKVYLDTSSDSSYSAALAFYDRVGFELEGRLVDYYEEGEDYLILGLSMAPA